MEFNENQLFYAALWWINALPGGPEHLPKLCEKYDKSAIIFPPYVSKRKPKEWDNLTQQEQNDFITKSGDEEPAIEVQEPHDSLSNGSKRFLDNVTTAIHIRAEFKRVADESVHKSLEFSDLDSFLECLFTELKIQNESGKSRVKHVGSHSSGLKYLDLVHSIATSSNLPMYPDHPFSDELERAMETAGIERGQMAQGAGVYIHNDGQLFVPQRNNEGVKMVSIDYPEKPVLPFENIPMTKEDFGHCPKLSWYNLYRIVPLEVGQIYKHGWMNVAGNRSEFEDKAVEGQVMLVSEDDFEDPSLFESMTDEEILNFDPRIRGASSVWKKEYELGYENQFSHTRIEATGKPNVIKIVQPPHPYMVAKEAVQLGFATTFTTVNPGDYILYSDYSQRPIVMNKEFVEENRGKFTFSCNDNTQSPEKPNLN